MVVKRFFLCLALSILLLGAVVCFADDSVVATVNGQPFSDFDEAFSFAQSVGGTLTVASDISLSSDYTIRDGVKVIVPSGISLSSSGRFFINASGQLINYGTLRSLDNSQSTFIVLNNGYFLNRGGNILATSSRGFALGSSYSSGVAVIDGGFIKGFQHAIYTVADPSDITIYGGYFQSETGAPIYRLSAVTFGPGVTYDLSEDGHTLDSSWGPLRYVRDFVVAGISWIGLFLGVVVENKILLLFIIVVFVGFAAGLIKRCMYL